MLKRLAGTRYKIKNNLVIKNGRIAGTVLAYVMFLALAGFTLTVLAIEEIQRRSTYTKKLREVTDEAAKYGITYEKNPWTRSWKEKKRRGGNFRKVIWLSL